MAATIVALTVAATVSMGSGAVALTGDGDSADVVSAAPTTAKTGTPVNDAPVDGTGGTDATSNPDSAKATDDAKAPAPAETPEATGGSADAAPAATKAAKSTAAPKDQSTGDAKPAPQPEPSDAPAPAPAPAAPAATKGPNDEVLANVRIAPAAAHVNQNVRVDADFDLGDFYPTGSHFTLTVPGELRPEATSFHLVTPDGTSAGDCVGAGQTITCTTTDFAEKHQGVRGSLFFTAKVTADNGANHESTLTSSFGTPFTVPLNVTADKYVPPTNIGKVGVPYPAAGVVNWGITVPVTDRSGGTTVITDRPSGPQTLPHDTSDYTVQCHMKDATGYAPLAGTFTVQGGGPNRTIKITDSACDGAYLVEYKAAVDASTPDGTDLQNKASAGADTVTAHAEWKARNPLTKDSFSHDDQDKASWTINADRSLVDGGKLTLVDTLPAGLTLDAKSLEINCRQGDHNVDVGGSYGHLPAAQYTLDSGRAGTALITISDAACAAAGGDHYQVIYDTPYPAGKRHTSYTNTVTSGSSTSTSVAEAYKNAGGNADGHQAVPTPGPTPSQTPTPTPTATTPPCR
ncbi:hypothetical protein GCM10025865_13180 [Paraoerskovia sediminicola]|uniref:SDR-like Ig domain-containing protein n=1 Tax=Paraoerskovia sediminicola TaxID=1138587 RepID=A0ABN6XB04_9CELL|nr:hypothetical protein GCM10025865_13180 [Paraoerskovia sediminicola]